MKAIVLLTGCLSIAVIVLSAINKWQERQINAIQMANQQQKTAVAEIAAEEMQKTYRVTFKIDPTFSGSVKPQ